MLEKGKIKPKKRERANQRSDFWLKRPDVEKLIANAQNLRDRCLVKLMYFGLVRRNEARSLKIEDIDFANSRLHLKITKRSRVRTVPIVEGQVFDDLRLHIGKRTTGWVFESKSKDGRLSNKALNNIVATMGREAGISQPNPDLKNLNPHILRHSYARHLRRLNPPIALEVLQKMMGHKNIQTTMDVYGTADIDFMEVELKRCAAVYREA